MPLRFSVLASLVSLVLAAAAGAQEARTLKAHEGWVGGVAFSPDGRTLAAGSWDRTIKLWDLARLPAPGQ